jgi:threonine synthase
MKFVSTNSDDGTGSVTFLEALTNPLPSRGHLWMPETLAPIEWPSKDRPFADFVNAAMEYFCPESWEATFLDYFSFQPVLKPRTFRNRSVSELQLFHGDTESFKDVGCFCAAKLYNHLFEADKYRVIVATSGDTGGAVAAAFATENGIPCTVLYPKGKISPYQEKQIVELLDPYHRVLPIAVSGDFDRCQKIAKQLLTAFPRQLLSSNSISLARLLPQIGYHAWAAAQDPDRPCTLIIPSGNMGNCVAALMAKRMGAPIARVHIACNENNAVAEYINHRTKTFEPKPTVVTPASAMDVGKASNFVRLEYLGAREDAAVSAGSASSTNIAIVQNETGVCPHTACGYDNLIHVPYADPRVIVVATASPAKFLARASPRAPIDRAQFNRIHRLHHCGFRTVFLVGPPNAGKGSIVDALQGTCWKSKENYEVQNLLNNVPDGVIALNPFIVDTYKTMELIRQVRCSCIVYLSASSMSIRERQKDRIWGKRMTAWMLSTHHNVDHFLQARLRKYLTYSDIIISTDYTPIGKCIRTLQHLVVRKK